MSQATNRDSTGSSASRASNGRLTPSRPLSISVPLASPFLLSSASRPPSSLSTEQWGDGAAYSGESEEEHELGEHEESASGWEDDGEEEEGSEHLEREGLLGRNVRSERLYFSPEDDEDDETDAPTTPVTLPTTSSSPSSMPQPYFDGGEVESPRISFPSSDEGMSIGPSGLSLAERLRLAEVGEAEGSGRWEGRRMQLEEEGWKRQSEEFLRADVEAGTNADEEQPPFATFQESPRILPAVDGDDGDLTYRLDRDLPLPPSDSRPATPASASMHSPRTSAISSSSSSNSSTLSLPSEPPVDLTLPNLPNRPGGTFMSVASGPLAQLASDGGSARSQTRGPRSFFSNILSRAAGHRPPNLPSAMNSSSSLSSPNRSPSAPIGFRHPSVGAAIRNGSHTRSSSLPSPDPSVTAFTQSRTSLNGPSEWNAPGEQIPRSPARGLASGLLRSASLRTPASPAMSSAPTSPIPSSPLGTSPTTARTRPEPPRSTSSPFLPPPPQPSLPPQTLGSIGLGLVPLTASLSLSRNSQPLCGALLDGKYILIGTTGGLEFLPIPFPGSLPMRTHGKKRRETRKPIPLIRRTRFKELAILSERSNILLAIAGRNDHIRVYALDGIRTMIERKMAELDVRDGYPVNPDSSQLVPPHLDPKGKGRAVPPSPTHPPRHSIFPCPPALSTAPQPSSSSSPFQIPARSPPPDYAPTAPPPPPRSSSHNPHGSFLPPPSPVRPSARTTGSSGSTVRGVPTNPRASSSRSPASISPRSLRGQKSRDFVATRRSTTASIGKRKSRADLHGDGASVGGSRSRRSSIYSGDERPLPPPPVPAVPAVPSIDEAPASAAKVEEDGNEGDYLLPATRLAHRRTSTTSTGESRWTTDRSQTPLIAKPLPRPEPRAAATSTGSGGQSVAMELADFLRSSGPGLSAAPVGKEDLASTGSTTRPAPAAEAAIGRRLQGGQRERSFSGQTRHIARSATVTSRDEDGYSASLDLVDFLRAGPPATASPRTNDAVPLAKSISRESSQAQLRPDERSLTLKGQASLPNRKLAREASTTRLRAGGRSTAQELSDLLRETGPSSSSPTEKEDPRARKEPREPARPRQPSSTLELAEFFRATGPSSSAPSTLRVNGCPRARPMSQYTTRSIDDAPLPTALASSSSLNRSKSLRMEPREARARNAADDSEEENDLPGARRREAMSLAQAIRDGPPADFVGARDAGSSSPTSSPGSRQNKRWTMSGMGSLFLNRPPGRTEDGPSSPNPQSSSRQPSSEVSRPPMPQDRPANSLGRYGEEAEEISVAQQPSQASRPLPPHDFKQRRDLLEPTETPTLPASSQLPPDTHPGNNTNSPLEYVKLARTKGARLLRACETKKRTYLAVLCGDEGERIELFTGSRSISLSLNRTFVLPENPRTIEFQLQGDDLVDIYLVYPESIFALEPATVRVREVGVGRGERRARRERERRMQDIASIDEHGLAPPEPPTATLYPADPALTEAPLRPITPDNSAGGLEGLAMGMDVGSRSPSPSPSRPPSRAADAPTRPPTPARGSSSPPPPVPPRNPESSSSDQPPPVPPRNKHILPYSTFQQLPFVPPVPSSVLSSAWIIPPLYTDVVESGAAKPFVSPSTESTENPAITITGDPSSSSFVDPAPPQFDSQQLPLLSPISLLGGAAQRANGPPGLFFVSKGRNLTGIVTADGRSVIKKPLVWSLDNPPESETTDVYHRIEVLVVGGSKTVVVGIGSSDAKAIAVGGGTGEAPFGAAVPVTSLPTSKPSDLAAVREVQFLGTHAPTNQLFYSQRVGANFVVYALFAK